MIKAWFLYLLAQLLTVSFFMVTEVRGVLWVFAFVLVLPWMAMGVHWVFPLQIALEVNLPDQGEKRRTLRGQVTMKNKGFLPYGRVKGRLYSENHLTGEVQIIPIQGALPPKGEKGIPIKLKSEYAGKILMSLKDVKIYDLFCLTYKRVKKEAFDKTFILPGFIQCQPLIFAQGNQEEDLFQVEYDDQVKGGDFSEIFQYKDYEKGDSLHRIHWKLSGKLGRMVVKEGSKPVPKSILLLLSTSCLEKNEVSNPKKRDALIETLISVSQGLLLQNIPHGMAFQDQEQGVFVHTLLEYEQDLTSFLPRVLSAGEVGDKKSALNHYQDHGHDVHYDHVILVTSEMPEETLKMESFSVLLLQEKKEENTSPGNFSLHRILMEDLEGSLMGLAL